MPDGEVAALMPAVCGALDWLRDSFDTDGDGFGEYLDESGHGLANQGWKDSADAVQWPDGTLASRPDRAVRGTGLRVRRRRRRQPTC